MSEISSVFVNDFKAALNGAKGEVDAWLECYNEAEVKAAINGLVAEKDAEILEQCRINGMGAEREATLLGKVERQSAALKLAREALIEMQDLIGESDGVYGLHMNGDVSPWEEVEQGGRFERLTTMPEALAAIDALGE